MNDVKELITTAITKITSRKFLLALGSILIVLSTSTDKVDATNKILVIVLSYLGVQGVIDYKKS